MSNVNFKLNSISATMIKKDVCLHLVTFINRNSI